MPNHLQRQALTRSYWHSRATEATLLLLLSACEHSSGGSDLAGGARPTLSANGHVVGFASASASPSARALPVSLPPATASSVLAAAQVDLGRSALPWSQNCQASRACPKVSPLPVCEHSAALDVSAFLAQAPEQQQGSVVTVRGELGITGGIVSLRGCVASEPRAAALSSRQGGWELPGATHAAQTAPATAVCCNTSAAGATLGRVPNQITLAGLGCSGDESRMCCRAPAFGQIVVAKGVLNEASATPIARTKWQLDQPSLCVETSR